MYAVNVEAWFSAAHQIRLRDGQVEPAHHHDWRVRACFESTVLDEVGMVVDFGEAQAALGSVVGQLHRTDLNSREDLAGKNPTAEVIAQYIFERLADLGLPALTRVEVTESPGCMAGYEPPH